MTKEKENSILAKIRQDMAKLNPQNLGGSKRPRIIRKNYELTGTVRGQVAVYC